MKTLDTRDLEERLKELESFKTTLDDARAELAEAEVDPEHHTTDSDAAVRFNNAEDAADFAAADFGQDELEELEELHELRDAVGSEWRHGVQLIPESDFEDYCRELCEGIGDLPSYIEIDWSATADNIRVDYTVADFQGETYLFLS